MKKTPAPSWASSEKAQLGLLVFFSLTVFFAKLGLNGMANFDDCFYAEKAKEVLQSGQLWTLTFNHFPAFENPPLYMWLAALSYKIFGINEYAAKFPSALMGLFNVVLIYFFGKFLFNRWVGFTAAFILATTYPFLKYARHAMVDVTLTFFVVSALFCLLLGLRKDKRYFLLWGLCIGLGILVKSVLGIFPLVISGVFIVLASQWKKIANVYFVLGCLLALGVGCSWYLVETEAFGSQFLSAHFGWLIFQRGFQGTPELWYRHLGFLVDLATYYWPWLPLAVLGMVLMFKAKRWKNENVLFILVWFFVILGIMSLMKARVLWYIMPVFPALALISAYALEYSLKEASKEKFTKALMVMGAVVVVLVNALPFPLDKDRERDVRIIAPYVKHFADEGDKVIAFREEYYGLNNALLFYSDHTAEPLYQTVGDVNGIFKSSSLVLCVAHKGDLPEIQKTIGEWYPVKYGEDMILISNRPLDIHDVRTW